MSLNFNEVTEEIQCPIYFASLASFPDLATAAQLTKNHRTDNPSYSKGFVLDIGTIKDLLAQNDRDISGIKIYMGKDIYGTSKAVAVATIGTGYDDFGIPSNVGGTCYAILGEARPCPSQCGRENALNR
jgi:hypothetical protein